MAEREASKRLCDFVEDELERLPREARDPEAKDEEISKLLERIANKNASTSLRLSFLSRVLLKSLYEIRILLLNLFSTRALALVLVLAESSLVSVLTRGKEAVEILSDEEKTALKRVLTSLFALGTTLISSRVSKVSSSKEIRAFVEGIRLVRRSYRGHFEIETPFDFHYWLISSSEPLAQSEDEMIPILESFSSEVIESKPEDTETLIHACRLIFGRHASTPSYEFCDSFLEFAERIWVSRCIFWKEKDLEKFEVLDPHFICEILLSALKCLEILKSFEELREQSRALYSYFGSQLGICSNPTCQNKSQIECTNCGVSIFCSSSVCRDLGRSLHAKFCEHFSSRAFESMALRCVPWMESFETFGASDDDSDSCSEVPENVKVSHKVINSGRKVPSAAEAIDREDIMRAARTEQSEASLRSRYVPEPTQVALPGPLGSMAKTIRIEPQSRPDTRPSGELPFRSNQANSPPVSPRSICIIILVVFVLFTTIIDVILWYYRS